MPYEIRDKKTKKVKANAVICRSLQCGHCLQPIVDGHTFLALDDPYFCVIHETCLSLFDFNEMIRTPGSEGAKKARESLDAIQAELHTMISRPWWTQRAPKNYQHALQQLLLLHQSLLTSGVLTGDECKPMSPVMSREQVAATTKTMTADEAAALFQ